VNISSDTSHIVGNEMQHHHCYCLFQAALYVSATNSSVFNNVGHRGLMLFIVGQ
jgi:hypothetical protein